jgi:hypothetical protein
MNERRPPWEKDLTDINTAAPVITRDEICIHAPIETIWDIQTDVASWPSWQPDVDSAQANGPLTVGSVFRWQTAGLDITSTVEEVDAPHRIAWGGPAQGIVAVHVCTLQQFQVTFVPPQLARLDVLTQSACRGAGSLITTGDYSLATGAGR